MAAVAAVAQPIVEPTQKQKKAPSLTSSIRIPVKQNNMVFVKETIITEDTAKIAAQHAKFVQMANDLVTKGTQEEVVKAIAFLDDIEKSYAAAKENETLDAILTTDKPYETAALWFNYRVIGHKVEHKVKSDDIASIVSNDKTDRIKTISLSKLTIRGDGILQKDWKPYAEKFTQLVSIRHAQNIGCDAARIKKLSTSYSMSKIAQDLAMGKTPTSNTQTCKLLQQVIDKLIWKEVDGKTENAYRVNNYDVAFIEDTFAKASKKVAMNLILATPKDVETLLLHVMHRLVTDGKYDFTARLRQDK
jgi:hypothetical protein